MTNNHELSDGNESEPTSDELFSESMQVMDEMRLPEELRTTLAQSMRRTLEGIVPFVTTVRGDEVSFSYTPNNVERVKDFLEGEKNPGMDPKRRFYDPDPNRESGTELDTSLW